MIYRSRRIQHAGNGRQDAAESSANLRGIARDATFINQCATKWLRAFRALPASHPHAGAPAGSRHESAGRIPA
jgi:hypothetical protein